MIVCYDIDLKYGRAYQYRRTTKQLMIYALGALRAYKMLFAIDKVKVSIVQPRIDNTSSAVSTQLKANGFGDRSKRYARIWRYKGRR